MGIRVSSLGGRGQVLLHRRHCSKCESKCKELDMVWLWSQREYSLVLFCCQDPVV